jgi:leader peptidase (prepilin peptidase)/N-methyltransferase
MTHDGWWAVGWALSGLLCGSFLNVVIHRWPRMLEASPTAPADYDLTRPRSHCPHCLTPLTGWQLVPILSFLWLRGRCGHCQAPISWRYPVVEGLGMAWWLWCGLALPAELAAGQVPSMAGWWPQAQSWGQPLAWGLWGSALLALAWIDWDTTWLPDDLTQPLVWGGLLAAGLGWSGQTLEQAVLGAVLGYASLWSVGTLFRWVTGEEGMGQGDFKLLAALGAWCGPLLLIPLVLLASILGLLAGLWLRARGGLREGRYIPFGPFLAAAAVVLRLGLDRPILSTWGVS